MRYKSAVLQWFSLQLTKDNLDLHKESVERTGESWARTVELLV